MKKFILKELRQIAKRYPKKLREEVAKTKVAYEMIENNFFKKDNVSYDSRLLFCTQLLINTKNEFNKKDDEFEFDLQNSLNVAEMTSMLVDENVEKTVVFVDEEKKKN